MPSKIRVKAGANGPVFMEGFPRRRLDENGRDMSVITDVAVEVPNTRYYRRRLLKCDLIRVIEMPSDARARVGEDE